MDTEAVAVDDAVAFLQKRTSVHGGSVYEHLTEVVTKILEERSDSAVDIFETSYIVKRTTPGIQSAISGSTNTLTPLEDEQRAKVADAFLRLLRSPNPEIDAETGVPVDVEPPNEYTCDDVMHDGSLFSAVGVGLCEEELVKVAFMVKRLGEDNAFRVASVRFFGKFFGLEADYYVFETTRKSTDNDTADGEEPPIEVDSGVNVHIYYVCNAPGDAFTRLPDVQPDYIQSARLLKRFMTGRLQSEVSTSFPLFPGNEAVYLRAQIARIACATTLCPMGHYELDEEDVMQKAEEQPDHSAEQLRELSSWIHLTPYLKKEGRCGVSIGESPEEDEEANELTAEEQEETPALLTPIEKDTLVEQGSRWTVVSSSAVAQLPHQVMGVRSNAWPGAVSVAKGGHYCSIYAGWGFKEEPYQPPPFPTILEPVDVGEWKEETSLPALPEAPDQEEEDTEQ